MKNKLKKNSCNKILFKILIGLLLKQGNKNKMFRIIKNSILSLKILLKCSLKTLICLLFNKLKVSVEFKKVRAKRFHKFIPFTINIKRKIFLIVKWLQLAIKKNKIKKNTEIKLTLEILKILNKKESFSCKIKRYNIAKSMEYRSTIHFRW